MGGVSNVGLGKIYFYIVPFSKTNYNNVCTAKLLFHQSPTKNSNYTIIDCVVTVDSCQQQSDYTDNQLHSHHATGR